MSRFFRIAVLGLGVAVLFPAVGMAELPSRAVPANGAKGALKGNSLQLAPRSQADALLQRLGYGAAVTGGGQAVQARSVDGRMASDDQAPRSQALQMMTGLRSGGAAGDDLAAPVPRSGGSTPGSLAGSVPGAGYAGIPGQNSPYTSTGNAAGVTPYPDYRRLLKRP